MTKQPDYLRDAKIHELLSGIFGWLWVATSVASVVWLLGAIFGDFSWWITLGLFLGSGFLRRVSSEYQRATQNAIQEGLEAGQLEVDSTGRARRKEREILESEEADMRQELSDTLLWAQDTYSRYRHVLSGHSVLPFFPEGVLTDSKDDIKRAILILSSAGQVAGTLSDSALADYRRDYAALSRAVPDSEASPLLDTMASISRSGSADHLSPEALRESIRQFSRAHKRTDPKTAGATMAAEFDSRLAEMVATYRDAAT